MKIGINVKLGIAAGIINCIAWYLIARSENYYSFNVEQYRYYVTLLLLLAGIPASTYLERKTNNGFIEFKDALKCGVLYSIVLALIIAIFNYTYYKFIVPDAIDYFVSETKKSMMAAKVKEEDIPKNIEFVTSYFSSFRVFMQTLIIGLLMSLAASAILRKKNLQSFQAN
ncbi:MAG: DUF4199 domain-containing protein [Bacteroidia bacterium]|jgi:hypothetical protein